MKHYLNVCDINGAAVPPVDIITFGSPCFVAGTLILTDKGYEPIETIKVGDRVLAHEGNWKEAEKIGSKAADTIILKGHNVGIECTKNHPFYSADNDRKWNGNGYTRLLKNVGEWTEASEMLGKRFAVPNNIQGLDIPGFTKLSNKENDPPQINADLFYLVGRYLGDGWVRNSQRSKRPEGQLNYQFIICDEPAKREELLLCFGKCFDAVSCSEEGAVVKVKTSNAPFVRWILDNFSHGSSEKTVPAWALCMPYEYRTALLAGYSDSDGYKMTSEKTRFTTVSHKLAEGMRLIAESLGYSCGISFYERPDKYTIQGRTVNQRDTYTLLISKTKVAGRIDTPNFSWYPIKQITDGHSSVIVYNIQVADDHSYIANGMVVHNCQDLSVAGKRAGLKHKDKGDEETTRSGLFMEAVRIIREMREATNGKYPKFALWENVVGALSSNVDEDYRIVIEELARLVDETVSIPRPEKGRWRTSGFVALDGGSIAWRVVDAQYHGVAQRRRRVLAVLDLTGQRAGEISFKCEGLPGYPAEECDQREAASGEVVYGIIGESEFGEFDYGYQLSLDDFIITDTFAIEGNGSRPSHRGDGYKESDTMYTLNTTEQHAVAYGICSYESNCMKSKNPNSGIYKADTSRTLDNNGGNPACNQGGIAVVEGIVLDDQGGQNVSARTDDKCPTLRAEMHGNVPGVIEEVSFPDVQDKTGSLMASGYNKLGTQEALNGMYVVEKHDPIILENHPADSRVKIDESGTVQTLTSRMGTGGGNVPMVMEPYGVDAYNQSITGDKTKPLTASATDSDHVPVVVEPNPAYTLKIRGGVERDCYGKKAGKGALIQTDKSDTLGVSQDQYLFQPTSEPIVLESNQNHATVNQTGICNTLPAAMGMGGGYVPMVTQPMNWDGSQTDPTLTANNANGAQRMPDKENFNCVLEPVSLETFHCSSEEDRAMPLKARDYKDPTVVDYGIDRSAFNQGENAKYDFSVLPEQQPTLTARGPGATFVHYIVRRLTPTECARLQGFPDDWGCVSNKDDMTDEEAEFWRNVYITHQVIVNGKKREEVQHRVDTKQKLLAWYNRLWNDGAEYKMWGNGVALPCVRVPIHNMAKFGAKTLASLFDGSGGFPLAATLEGIEPVWCSEIEPYPIAVTMERFPEVM